MKSRSRSVGWWLGGAVVYGAASGCLAVAYGLIGAWSFGMHGQIPVLFRNRLLFPTQWIMPLAESFDLGHVFLHSFASGFIYSTVGLGAIFAYRAIERFRKGE